MASVTSLGVHEPSAVSQAIEEQVLLPPLPAPDAPQLQAPFPSQSQSHFTWDVPANTVHDADSTDELLITKQAVLWSRGRIFRKSFKFELEKEPVTHALLAYFPVSEDSQSQSQTADTKNDHDRRPLYKALVVFLQTQAHIFFLNGPSHVVHMPFEVESACAAPRGIVIQRKLRMGNMAAVTLKFPKVPPNSFVSSQICNLSSSAAQLPFSTEGLGKPKTLPLRLSTQIGPMWEPPIVHTESHWPRLVCLTDPLLEMGLVVTQAEAPSKMSTNNRRPSAKGPFFLDAAEEILHMEAIPSSATFASSDSDEDPLTIAVTENRDAGTYTVWKVTYLKPDDTPFARPKKPAVPKSNRRRSSMQPGFVSGASTPVQPNFRDSFGAPLPGKRPPRKSERHDKPVDIASTIQADKDGGVARRQSRRVSSMLARTGDLSTSQDRSIFDGSKRIESQGSQYGQYHRQSVGAHHGSLNAGSLANASNAYLEPHDDLLDELRSAGDFDGPGFRGLEDHDFDGVSQEILFSKIHSVAIDNSNFRYSSTTQPAKGQCKVFVVVGSPFVIDEQQRNQVLIGIQDPADKRLQLLSFHLQRHKKFDFTHTGKRATSSQTETTILTWSQLRKAQHVIDSCKITDGGVAMILVLMEGNGQYELSLQAPWSRLSTIPLPPVLGRSSEIIGLAHSRAGGLVDIKDSDGNYHELRIQLEPTSVHVRKVLEACRSILPPSHSEQVLVGWWSIMHWLREERAPFPDYEWSCAVVLIFTMYLALGMTDSRGFKDVPRRQVQGDIFASFTAHEAVEDGVELDDWNKMQTFETSNSSPFPEWMCNKAWDWMILDEDTHSTIRDPGPLMAQGTSFITRHIGYAKQFISSSAGVEATGPHGYLPTALGRMKESRRRAARDMLQALHLLSEEQKLDVMSPEYLSPGRADLRVVLFQLAKWLHWDEYSTVYELGIQGDPEISREDAPRIHPPLPEPLEVFCVYDWIQQTMAQGNPPPFPRLADIFYAGAALSEEEKLKDRRWHSLTPRTLMFRKFFDCMSSCRSTDDLMEALYSCGFTRPILETLPDAALVPLQDLITRCQTNPPPSWSPGLLDLVNRSDVSMMLAFKKPAAQSTANILPPTHTASWDYSVLCRSNDEFYGVGYSEDSGTEIQTVVRALFRDDRRLDEAKNLLNTTKPRAIRLNSDPKWTDAQYLEKQKELVTKIAAGTLAIPSGRGLLFYSMKFPLLTQKFAIQGFNLNCIVRPTNVTVGVDKSLYQEEKVSWAFFHQGVAGGLSISPQAKGIDTSWILYNKPGGDLSNRHAGFLLALGLNGHLRSVAKWVAFKYLTPKHTMTSIGLLLGLAASYLGTMDSLITRLLSVHVTRMLPRGAAELNLSQLTQTTGILGIGLLYANTQHRRMSEIMASEIAHVDADEEEEPLRSECYRLASGFALGLINLARGNSLRGLSDMKLAETLLSLATATKKVDAVQVLDRAAAPATVAIALIFMRTEDAIVARKIDVPESVLQFEYIRPDVLLLRTLATNLILWSRIEASFEWVRDSLPSAYRARHKLADVQKLTTVDLPFFAITAGLCFAIALRFAGSGDMRVRDLLVHYLDQFHRITLLPATTFDARMARQGASMALDTLALSAATVMSGTGDLIVLRRLRALHGREDSPSQGTSYGSHLAAHLAVGALFLGCGTKTFGTGTMATAALVMAFYPVWPGGVMDNRAHLQAARHFWTLAVEERCLVAREVGGGVIEVGVVVKLFPTGSRQQDQKGSGGGKERGGGRRVGLSPIEAATPRVRTTPTPVGRYTPALPRVGIEAPSGDGEAAEATYLRLTTPTLLPPLEQIAGIRTEAGPLFWDLGLDFEGGGGKELRERFARSGMGLYLRRRPGVEGVVEGTVRSGFFAPNAFTAATDRGVEGGASALGNMDLGTAGTTTATADASLAGQGKAKPMQWLFSLPSLASLTAIEQAAVMGEGDCDGGLARAVDSRLVLQDGVAGGSREELLGLRMVFEWAQKREEVLGVGVGGGVDVKGGNSKGKEKAKVPRVSVGGDVLMGDIGEEDVKGAGPRDPGVNDRGRGWWLRDTVVDEIKGRVFLGGQGPDQGGEVLGL